ncbi:hypothetical protein [Streptosporangium subroseum]|nr:hypothetical protein [Streptosporangium subroseum]
MTWAAVVAVATLFAASPASAFTASPAPAFTGNGTLSTTGAVGAYKYVRGSGGWDLFARDPLSDGHCAQWQIKHPGGSWAWYGNRVCTGTETYVYAGALDEDQIRICRTGTGNCSASVSLELS